MEKGGKVANKKKRKKEKGRVGISKTEVWGGKPPRLVADTGHTLHRPLALHFSHF